MRPDRKDRDRSALSVVLRVFGWVMIAAGAVVVLYVVYVLFYTGLETSRAQSAMFEAWQEDHGSVAIPQPGDAAPVEEGGEPQRETPAPPDVGEAVAVLAFHRPGSDVVPVTEDYLMVVEGVGYRELQRGPGHYPDTAMPGDDGNFAVAGHRVTYSAPFQRLDDLQAGDEIHVWDRAGAHHVYRFERSEIVSPWDGWTLEEDPIGIGAPTLTLTTCHPMFSNRERMIAFGELVS